MKLLHSVLLLCSSCWLTIQHNIFYDISGYICTKTNVLRWSVCAGLRKFLLLYFPMWMPHCQVYLLDEVCMGLLQCIDLNHRRTVLTRLQPHSHLFLSTFGVLLLLEYVMYFLFYSGGLRSEQRSDFSFYT